MIDIVCTWPKKRTLEDYLGELDAAIAADLWINYHISSPPTGPIWRCYMVHDGAVRCWSGVMEVTYREYGQVTDVKGGPFWPEGWYVVRSPYYRLTEPFAMKGFQGWRYFDRSLAPDKEAA
jgi:hypothetical protein